MTTKLTTKIPHAVRYVCPKRGPGSVGGYSPTSPDAIDARTKAYAANLDRAISRCAANQPAPVPGRAGKR